MGKIYEKIINRFDGGMISDPRAANFRYARVIKNFDAHTYPKKLVPSRSSEAGDTITDSSIKRNYCIALRTGTTYKLFALSRKDDTATTAKVTMKSLTTGGTSDMSDSGWDTPANNESSSGATDFEVFVYYKRTGLIYGVRSKRYIWAFDPTSAAAWDDTSLDLGSTATYLAQGLVHSKDDILYIPYDNKIAKNNNGAWTAAALTLPTHLYITSICEYGDYLAIACAPVSGVGKSVVYLWDRNSTDALLSESIDWGEGNLRVLEEIEGRLIGISWVGGFTQKIVFREYAGGKAKVFKVLIDENTTFSDGKLPIAKQKKDNFLYFLMDIKIGGTAQQGLWKVGRVSPDKPFSVVLDKTPNNDTAVGNLLNFFIYKDYTFISYTNTDGTYGVSKTNDQAVYNVNAYYETLIINADDSSKIKKLLGVSVMFEPLPSAGKVALKYKKDEETSWTTIFENFTTDDALSHSAVNIESSGDNLPEFEEIQFQVISRGGAVITGLKLKAEVLDKDIY